MRLDLDFKTFMEMPHIAIKRHGMPTPFPFDGKFVKFIDMKFETYPPGAPERKLTGYDAKFYGKIPGSNQYLVMDDVSNCYVTNHKPEDEGHVELADDWVDYAVFLYMDGSIKEPKRVREESPHIV